MSFTALTRTRHAAIFPPYEVAVRSVKGRLAATGVTGFQRISRFCDQLFFTSLGDWPPGGGGIPRTFEWGCAARSGNAYPILSVSMGLTVSRQTAKNLTVNRQKRTIFIVNRQKSTYKLAVKRLQGLSNLTISAAPLSCRLYKNRFNWYN